MSSTSSIAQVPMLNGANYASWEISMKAYLRLQGIWRVVSGDIKRPSNMFNVTKTEVPTGRTIGRGDNVQQEMRIEEHVEGVTTPERKKEQAEWDRWDDMAQGAIQMRIPTDVARNVMKDTAEETWDEIYATYGSPGAAGKFALFREAITFTISDNSDPSTPISSLMSLFSRLAEVEIEFTDPIKAMIILAALPASWDSFCATILAQHDILKPSSIIPSIADEYRRRKSGNSTALTARLSGVRRPNDNTSNWNSQKKKKGKTASSGRQPSQSSQDNSSTSGNTSGNNKKKTRCGSKGGKNRQNAHESTADTSSIPVANFATAHVAHFSPNSPLIQPPAGKRKPL